METEVSFFDIHAWGKLGETVSGKSKGQGVRVVGRLKQDRWIDQTGKQCSKVVIVAEHVEFKAVRNQNDSAPEDDGVGEEGLTDGETEAEEPLDVKW
jgi:single-strand DNA-binding protein